MSDDFRVAGLVDWLMQYGWILIVILIVMFISFWYFTHDSGGYSTISEYCGDNAYNLTACYCTKHNFSSVELSAVQMEDYAPELTCVESRSKTLKELDWNQLARVYECMSDYSCRSFYPDFNREDVLFEMLRKQQNSIILIAEYINDLEVGNNATN